ncbi:hypothetical protein U9M48_035089 [Paspalum notatum var. saurae]|uniref:Uncharacterized protein n=1 Tax=Paspalum notatum var. saurae TaxID=547442 RepID=A0AAQ3X8K8_PASNO
MTKKEKSINGTESYVFSSNNKLIIFLPNTFKFKDKMGYFLSKLNSLLEYFNTINIAKTKSSSIISSPQELLEQKILYIIYDGPQPGLYISFEEIIMQNAKRSLRKVKKTFRNRFYIDPLVKTYIQNYKGKKASKLIYPKVATPQPIKAKKSSLKPSYKQLLQTNTEPIDKEYLEWKMIKLF